MAGASRYIRFVCSAEDAERSESLRRPHGGGSAVTLWATRRAGSWLAGRAGLGVDTSCDQQAALRLDADMRAGLPTVVQSSGALHEGASNKTAAECSGCKD